MKCIIIDDEVTARAVIEQLCQQIGGLDVVAQFDNAVAALKYTNKSKVDVIFLDIQMPSFTGFDFLDSLKTDTQVVLITSNPHFALESYNYACVEDYLLKPIHSQRFIKTIDKISRKLGRISMENSTEAIEKDNDVLFINIDRRLVKIVIDEIYLIEANGDYVLIKTLNKNYSVHVTVKKLLEKLPTNKFVRVHRGYVINISKITDIEDNSVLIERDVIPISRSNRPELMRKLNLL